MNRINAFRVTGSILAIVILVLGVTSTTLLYYAGDRAVEFFYQTNFVYDSFGRMSRPLPQDSLFGTAIMKAWAVGFIYILTAILAFVASLFCKKYLVIVYFIVALLTLIVGSFLHTAGGMALLVYRLLVGQGLDRRDFFFPSCVLQLPNGDLQTDARCLLGREALNLLVAALVFLGITWLVTLADVIFHARTYGFVSRLRTYNKKKGPPQRQREVTQPSRRRREATARGPVASPSGMDSSPRNIEAVPIELEPAAPTVSEHVALTESEQQEPVKSELPSPTVSEQPAPTVFSNPLYDGVPNVEQYETVKL